jgi:hypothetical protein
MNRIEIPQTPTILRNTKATLHIDHIKVRNLYELVDVLETLPEHLYELHLRNDDNLSRWAKYAFENDALAKDLRKAHTPMHTQNVVLKHLTRALANLNHKTFQHYLSTPYANWVKIHINDRNFAKKLNTATPNQARAMIIDRLHAIIKEQRKIHRCDQRTPMMLTPYRKIIHTDQKTNLPLGQLILHEVNANHHGVIQIASYLTFGIVVGGALMVLILAFA